ncbi:MAG: hypothetical protein ACD_51C00264G0002 [uncultured bacterium]|nr:MAG: hypothetical protein ACD_51C00264G0002 [uncultured bacterium]OGJ47665.1 MAG: hypothetical protein A2244_02915 [Candidatus Peregrinibacteria bacterium RIFOXYA2_FULL_41_18]OGJ49561.1 MAG: hypothetical protein A2344_01725 [Candidatus Peregrinibacteria bacterium RIFOXYB12_FULL_41_12]OGJ54484.1 MAG: hypothetical protein A2336_03395 [Candidatus Peregrinibacteria bacterium RIFOXYB2_FULL_41_88]
MNNDLKQYMGLFETESKKYIQDLNNNLVKLEKDPKNQNLLYEIMRFSHSLKGMNATMGFHKLQELCHKMEDIFDAARKGKLDITKEVTSVVFEALDVLELGLKKVMKEEAEPETQEMVSKLENSAKQSGTTTENIADIQKKEPAQQIEVEEIKEVTVSVERLDTLMGLMEDMVTLEMRLSEIDKTKNYKNVSVEIDKLKRITQEIQYNVTQARMVQVGYLFQRFPRMVRDLASEQGKEIEFEVEGDDIKLDRNIIDELSEPLVHLLRNSVDHGIEKTGKIRLVARREKNTAIIELSDNGKGLDLVKIKKVAIDKKIVTKEEADSLDEKGIINLIFDPLLSTKDEVTDVSGRGVGMAAVKSKMEALNGVIHIETKLGEGTKFTLELPLTLAIIKALLVGVEDEIYAIPLNYIDRNVYFSNKEIKKAADSKVGILEGDDIPLVSLANVFGIKKTKEEKDKVLAVVVRKGDGRVGLVIDRLIQEQDIIVKPLSKLFKGRKEFGGITVLGDGRSVLIIDVQNLT